MEETDERIYYGGYGIDMFAQVQVKSDRIGFGGSSWIVESRDELLKAEKIEVSCRFLHFTKTLLFFWLTYFFRLRNQGATSIQPYLAPGGGEIVTAKDCWGNDVNFIFGQMEKVAPIQPRVIWNYGETDLDGKKRKGEFQRFERGPAKVHKLGQFFFTSTFQNGTFEHFMELILVLFLYFLLFTF